MSILKDRGGLGKSSEPVLRLLPESCSLFFTELLPSKIGTSPDHNPSSAFNHMFLQKIPTYACILHTRRDGFIEELTMWELVGYETRLKGFLYYPFPLVCCPKVMLSLPVTTQESHFFPYLREEGWLWQDPYSWKWFYKRYPFHLGATHAAIWAHEWYEDN